MAQIAGKIEEFKVVVTLSTLEHIVLKYVRGDMTEEAASILIGKPVLGCHNTIARVQKLLALVG